MYKINLGFKMPKEKKNNIDVNLFMTNVNEYTSYLLGLLWADGSLCNNMVALECVKEDVEPLKNVFLLTGDWNIRYRTRNKWKPQMVYHISNKHFSEYLKSCDYSRKSHVSPEKILYFIPDQFKNYWFRGYWDGDGCFYFNNKNKAVQCTATSTYEQDWSFLANLYDLLNIRYSIRKVKTNKSCYSQIRVTNQKDSLKLINFLYDKKTNLGIIRKQQKAQLILNAFKEKNVKN